MVQGVFRGWFPDGVGVRALVLFVLVGSAGAGTTKTLKVSSSQSFNAREFTVQIVLHEDTGAYSIHDLRYPSPVESPHPANNVVPAELYLPAGIRGVTGLPAVVCLHILNGDFALSRTVCARLASAGVVALFFKQPYYGERGGELGRRIFTRDPDVFSRALHSRLR